MCDPMTLATIATITSTTMQVGSLGAQQIEAENQARFAKQKGEVEAAQARRQGAELRSAQRARIAKAGVQPVGTAELVLQETAADAEYNAIMAKYNANLKATAYNNTARARSREVFGAIARGGAQYATNEAIFNPPKE